MWALSCGHSHVGTLAAYPLVARILWPKSGLRTASRESAAALLHAQPTCTLNAPAHDHKHIRHGQPKREQKLRSPLQQTRATGLSCSSRCWIRRGRGPRRRGLRSHPAPRSGSPCGAPPCSLGLSLRAARRPGDGPVEGGHAVGDGPVFAVPPRSHSGVQPRGRDDSWGCHAARGHVEAGRRGGRRAVSTGVALDRWTRGGCRRRGLWRTGPVLQSLAIPAGTFPAGRRRSPRIPSAGGRALRRSAGTTESDKFRPEAPRACASAVGRRHAALKPDTARSSSAATPRPEPPQSDRRRVEGPPPQTKNAQPPPRTGRLVRRQHLGEMSQHKMLRSEVWHAAPHQGNRRAFYRCASYRHAHGRESNAPFWHSPSLCTMGHCPQEEATGHRAGGRRVLVEGAPEDCAGASRCFSNTE